MVAEKMEADGARQSSITFTRREVRERIGWGLTQTRLHLETLAELEYVAPRGGRNGVAFTYALSVDAREEAGLYHIGLIDTEKIKATYGDDLTEKTAA